VSAGKCPGPIVAPQRRVLIDQITDRTLYHIEIKRRRILGLRAYPQLPVPMFKTIQVHGLCPEVHIGPGEPPGACSRRADDYPLRVGAIDAS
jgi:hypothetical protein